MKTFLYRIFLLLALFFILFHPEISKQGATDGLLLWFQTVIPTLFPFMLLTNFFVSMGLVGGKLYAVMIGFLCGYPMGGKAAADLVLAGKISKKEGQRLMAIVNLPSPMFLIAYVNLPGLLYAIYLPALFLVFALVHPFGRQKKASDGNSEVSTPLFLEDPVTRSCNLILKIGAYIILFSILSAYIQALPFRSLAAKGALLGAIEITTGVHFIKQSGLGSAAIALLATAVCTFGGFCAAAQTISATREAGFSLLPYFGLKLLHAMLSCLLMFLFLH